MKQRFPLHVDITTLFLMLIQRFKKPEQMDEVDSSQFFYPLAA